MPDCHSGYGMPIGGVLATDNIIIPNAVGVDIGCGMTAVRTNLKEITEDQIKEILGLARMVIPVGFKRHETKPEFDIRPTVLDVYPKHILEKIKVTQGDLESQLGTLGGGNHFIEIQQGSDGYIWLMIHTGSRNLGKRICDYYNNIAKEANREMYSVVEPQWSLAFLPLGTEIGDEYFMAMRYATDFATANRFVIMKNLKNVVKQVIPETVFTDEIRCEHNYAAMENHYGKNVMVHRKGAIRMREGDTGIIPGSMGTNSYIVKGLGNPQSFYSASHGAGRVMSRSKANELITEEMAQEAMKGIVFGRFNGKYDECPQAYKDISTVMTNQLDLVEPVVELKPLGVMKG
jgi:tRNA-splicing ligase RtcB